MKRLLIALVLLPVLASATVVTKRVEYRDGDAVLEGYLAYDDAKKDTPRPGVIIVHDWDGLNDYEEGRARMLADLGYVAFAVDIYGKGVHPKTAQENGAQAGKFRNDNPLFRSRLKAGLDALLAQPMVDKDRTAAIGYCFGGTGVLELARSGAAVRGVVSFHGGLGSTTKDAANIKCKVNIQNGAADPVVPPEQIQAFQKEMEEAKVDYSFTSYAAAVHAFTVPGRAYNAAADKRSWEAMRAFFKEIFGE